MKVNDLFCGAGGFGLGFKQAGFKTVGAWDKCEYAVQSYKANVSNVAKVVDIIEMQGSDMPVADMWSLGFPCQDISRMGDMAGMDGKHSSMFFHVMRLLDETADDDMPTVILAENVPRVVKYLELIGNEYEKRGYRLHVARYNSKFWLPQSRDRYFLIGTRLDRETGETFPFPEQPQTVVDEVLIDIMEEDVPQKFYIPSTSSEIVIQEAEKLLREGLVRKSALNVIGYLDIKAHEHNQRVYDPYGMCPTLTAVSGGTHHIKVFDYRAMLARKLTPREYARLQGFPDDYLFVVSNKQLYKQFGNAVTVPLANVVANSISKYLGKEC